VPKIFDGHSHSASARFERVDAHRAHSIFAVLFGGERIANMLTIVSRGIAPGLNPREYLVLVTRALLERRPVAELLPDRIAVSHPTLCIPGFTALAGAALRVRSAGCPTSFSGRDGGPLHRRFRGASVAPFAR
jgi:hypothetical protein